MKILSNCFNLYEKIKVIMKKCKKKLTFIIYICNIRENGTYQEVGFSRFTEINGLGSIDNIIFHLSSSDSISLCLLLSYFGGKKSKQEKISNFSLRIVYLTYLYLPKVTKSSHTDAALERFPIQGFGGFVLSLITKLLLVV